MDFFCRDHKFAEKGRGDEKPSPRCKNPKGKTLFLPPHRVFGPARHVPHHHVGDGQDLPIFGLLNEDGHAARHQLAVVLDALRAGDELPIRVVPCAGAPRYKANPPSACKLHIFRFAPHFGIYFCWRYRGAARRRSCFAAFQHFMDGKTEAGSPPTPSHGSSNL